MALQIPEKELDPFAAPIAGQSLTDPVGRNPYENPPQIVDPVEAFTVLKESIEEPDKMRSIINIIDAGISAETVASTFVMKMFSEGVITPDVAEIIKPPLIAAIVDMATEAGIEDIAVVNELPRQGLTEKDSLDLMSKINPEKYRKRIMDTAEEMDLINEVVDSPQPLFQEPMQETGNGGFIERETV